MGERKIELSINEANCENEDRVKLLNKIKELEETIETIKNIEDKSKKEVEPILSLNRLKLFEYNYI